MRSAAILVALLAASARAEYQVHGFSADGRYFAFEDHGGFHSIAGYWSKIRVIDVKSDTIAHAPFIDVYENPDEKPPVLKDEAVRARNLRKAAPTLRKLGIKAEDGGEAPALAFVDKERKGATFELGGKSYQLLLSEIAHPDAECHYGGGNTYTYKLVLKGPKGDRILHEEKTVPKSRGRDGCVAGYSIHEVRVKGGYMVVVLSMDVASPEGRGGGESLAVGAAL